MSSDDQAELSQRCIESISRMGNSPAVLVDADGYSDEAIVNVAAQLQEKGWRVELAAGSNDSTHLVISPPAARSAAAPAPAPVTPAPPPPPQKTFAQQMADDNLREWVELEQNYQRGESPDVTFTTSKTKIIWAVVIIAALGAFAIAWFSYISPRRQLDELAEDTCQDIDGAMLFVAAEEIMSSVRKAEQLGFTGHELGDRMREHCPSLMRQLDALASGY